MIGTREELKASGWRSLGDSSAMHYLRDMRSTSKKDLMRPSG